MGVLTLNGAPLTMGGSPLVMGESTVSGHVPFNLRNAVFMNSLFDHDAPAGVGADAQTLVAWWLLQLCAADGMRTFTGNGAFGFPNTSGWQIDPPSVGEWSDMEVPGLGVGLLNSWAKAEAAAVNCVTYVPDNFDGYQYAPDEVSNMTAPNPPPGNTYAGRFGLMIGLWDANTSTPDVRYRVYQGWKSGGSAFQPFPPPAAAFDNWIMENSAGQPYPEWHRALVADLQAQYPSLDIDVIPIAEVMTDVMVNTAASSLAVDDWFVDWAPHGTETCYLLAAMIYFSDVFQAPCPMLAFNPAWEVHPTFVANYGEIAARIASRLGV